MANVPRALHYVFKIPQRKATIDFYTKVLGMRVLRHEEFEKGCEAACNGRYDGHWSKTLIGYGSEDQHFDIELVFNYTKQSYTLGNEFKRICIQGDNIIEKVKASGHRFVMDSTGVTVEAPGGYMFHIKPGKPVEEPLREVVYSSSNLEHTRHFWVDILKANLLEKHDNFIVVAFDEKKFTMRFELIHAAIDRAEAYGRIAFSVPRSDLQGIQDAVLESKSGSVLNPLMSLQTPGKATVEVVILQDPDGHEICYVGDEAYRELSKDDPDSIKVLEAKIAEHEAHMAKKTRF